MEEERRRHVYVLNGESKVSSRPVAGVATPPHPPSGAQANGDNDVAVPTRNTNQATGATAPGMGRTGAVHSVSGNASAEEQAQGGDGAVAGVD